MSTSNKTIQKLEDLANVKINQSPAEKKLNLRKKKTPLRSFSINAKDEEKTMELLKLAGVQANQFNPFIMMNDSIEKGKFDFNLLCCLSYTKKIAIAINMMREIGLPLELDQNTLSLGISKSFIPDDFEKVYKNQLVSKINNSTSDETISEFEEIVSQLNN